MQMLADLRQVPDGRDEARRDVAWMRAREPDPLDPLNLVDGFQERSEVASRVVRRAVMVDDLSQKLNLAMARCCGLARFGHNLRFRPHPLVASRVRYDAERAELVAALDD